MYHFYRILKIFVPDVQLQSYNFKNQNLYPQMQANVFSDIPINDSNNHLNSEQLQNLNKDQKKEDFDQNIYQEKDQQINPTFQTYNTLVQKSQEILSSKEQTSKSKQQKSVFHNFQKHLVITLRQSIKIKKSLHKKEPQTVAWQIWENFVKQTKIYTKNILHIVFGVVDYESSDLTNIYDEQIIGKFGYSEIFAKYSDPLLTEAQSYLRSQVVRQLKKLELNEMMKKRRLSNVNEFGQYVKQFIGQLEQGPMRKRLPKNKKADMKLQQKNKIS